MPLNSLLVLRLVCIALHSSLGFLINCFVFHLAAYAATWPRMSLFLSRRKGFSSLASRLILEIFIQCSVFKVHRKLFLFPFGSFRISAFDPVGLSGLEPPTSRLSGVRSNRLSYKPFRESGSHLLSHAVSSIVPSAVWGLTIVFGMGTGVAPRRIATGNLPGFLASLHN